MADYKKAYLLLFNRMTDILEEIKKAQLVAEDEIVSSQELVLCNT